MWKDVGACEGVDKVVGVCILNKPFRKGIYISRFKLRVIGPKSLEHCRDCFACGYSSQF